MTDAPRAGHPQRWTILALILAAECMDLLDGTIVNVAAPTIHRDLGATLAALQWVIGGYALGFAVGLITGARLGDIYGRRRLFVIGALGFVLASSACAFAPDPLFLITCRLVQGLAAAMLIPQGLGILREVFPPEEQGRAFTWFGPVIGLSAVLGPVVGGLLIAANVGGSSWRLVFLVNLPLGLAAALGAARLMPECRAPERRRLDLVGALLGALGMGLLVYPLIQGRQAGWPLWTYLMVAGAALSFALLIAWTALRRRRGGDPLVEPEVFLERSYLAGLGTILVFFAGMSGLLLIFTLFLQLGERFSAIHAGLTLLPFAAGSAVGATLGAVVLVPRFGRTALQLASLVMAAGVGLVYGAVAANGLGTDSLELVLPLLVLGAGIGMFISPVFDFALAAVSDSAAGSASGVLNAVQQLAGALGVAAVGTIFFSILHSSGFVVGVERCLLVELGTTPVLLVLARALPYRPRDPEVVSGGKAGHPLVGTEVPAAQPLNA